MAAKRPGGSRQPQSAQPRPKRPSPRADSPTVPVRRSGAAPSDLPAGYGEFLEDLKSRIRTAQVKATLSVNRELIELYWGIGRDIVQRQQGEGWGRSVVERLASDLRASFPGVSGFSSSNIWRIRAFYLAWSNEASILAQVVREMPWGHSVVLIEKVKDPAARLWYARQIVTNGWSRNILALQIESDLYRRQGKAVTNFKAALPPPQSDLAQEITKDPYVFDFLTLAADARELEVERELLSHVTRFLLELGAGFAFVGRQFPIEVDGEDYFIDLLFYHVRLHCYVVIDLKTRAFKPEDAGKMNFYLSAVDDRVRGPRDEPTIGLILCRGKSRVTVEYALRDMTKPIGVAGWATKLTESLPEHLRDSLPGVEQLEAELRKAGVEGRTERPA